VDEAYFSLEEAARIMGVPESEVRRLACPDGRIPLEAICNRTGTTMLALARELAHAREKVGCLSAQLKEVRATNLRLQKEIKESVEERRRLTEEVLELRAASEERLMLMERIEHVAGIEQTLEEAQLELARLQERRLLARIFNR
jgi:DNA repair exonuclease SbcCD nuclease subunit